MAIIAVAGGTGNVGRTIVEAIIAAGKHDVKILSRSANPELEAKLNVPIIVVDYSNVEAVTKVLEDNNVYTVVSAIAMLPKGDSTPQEIELIRAADASKTTKRMISSDWGFPHTEDHIGKIGSVIHKMNAQKELKKAKDLEWTVFLTGFFLDFWAFPVVKTYAAQMTLILDIPNETAAIPGSGTVPVVFTHTTDIAKFVAASLDLEKWDHETFVMGDKITWNEFVRLAEEAKGAKFKITYDSIEKLKTGKITELPSQPPMYAFFPKEFFQKMSAAFGLWFEEGMFNFQPKRFLNEQFPNIKPWTVKTILDTAWKQPA